MGMAVIWSKNLIDSISSIAATRDVSFSLNDFNPEMFI